MNSIRDSVIRCLSDVGNEDRLLTELNRIVAQEGKESYRVLLHVLTNLDMEQDDAETCWKQIIQHYEHMNQKVERQLNLRTVICDYFCSINKSLVNPKVIEINIYEKTVKASRYDSLTGLFNRQSLDEALKREISRARRYKKELSIIFFDLDDFKYVNDTYGHHVGDDVLKQIADIIVEEKRMEDIAARYGGEEIVIILPETEKNSAYVLADRIRSRIENMGLSYEGQPILLTVSGGLASFPSNAKDEKTLLQCADKALYLAKGAGKNHISFYSKDKRNYLRVAFNADIVVGELGLNSPGTFDAKSINISIGGLLFETNTAMEVGTKMQISLPLDEGPPLLIIGRVVRMTSKSPDRYEIAVSISFQEMERKIKNRITKWINLKKLPRFS